MCDVPSMMIAIFIGGSYTLDLHTHRVLAYDFQKYTVSQLYILNDTLVPGQIYVIVGPPNYRVPARRQGIPGPTKSHRPGPNESISHDLH